MSPDTLPGMLPADRNAWNDTPAFLGWPAELQRVHAAMTEASTRLVNGLEVLLDEPEGSVQELMGLTGMNQLGLELVDRVTHHHAYEDRAVLPQFLSMFPEMGVAVELLERDHDFLDTVLTMSRELFLALQPQVSSKSNVSIALRSAKELQQILHRHTYDEEDLLIPALLHAQVHF
ncbi:MAG: hemerythrin domain-containing protein [Pseudomonadota bacterium]